MSSAVSVTAGAVGASVVSMAAHTCGALASGPLLHRLAGSTDVRVRRAVASNARADRDDVVRLAADRDALVRRRVAGRDWLPGPVVRLLAGDVDGYVRVLVASRAGVPGDVVAALATDSCVRVRQAVAGNVVTPVEVLRVLADDSDQLVAATVARRRAQLLAGEVVTFRGAARVAAAMLAPVFVGWPPEFRVTVNALMSQ